MDGKLCVVKKNRTPNFKIENYERIRQRLAGNKWDGLMEVSDRGQPDMEEQKQNLGKPDYPPQGSNLLVLNSNESECALVTGGNIQGSGNRKVSLIYNNFTKVLQVAHISLSFLDNYGHCQQTHVR